MTRCYTKSERSSFSVNLKKKRKLDMENPRKKPPATVSARGGFVIPKDLQERYRSSVTGGLELASSNKRFLSNGQNDPNLNCR
ncbi:MAG: hypothetical protein Kow0088_20570 [Anaerolineales bacterium]